MVAKGTKTALFGCRKVGAGRHWFVSLKQTKEERGREVSKLRPLWEAVMQPKNHRGAGEGDENDYRTKRLRKEKSVQLGMNAS